MQIKYGVTVIATLQEVFNIVGKELGISDRNQWAEERALKSRVLDRNIYSYRINGRDSNKASNTMKDKTMELGRIWVFSTSKNKQGKVNWTLRTYVTFGQAKKYYYELKSKGNKEVWLFINEKLVKENEKGFNLYELEFHPEVISVFKVKSKLEQTLLGYYSDNEEIYDNNLDFKMVVSRNNNEIPYEYNQEAHCINWL